MMCQSFDNCNIIQTCLKTVFFRIDLISEQLYIDRAVEINSGKLFGEVIVRNGKIIN